MSTAPECFEQIPVSHTTPDGKKFLVRQLQADEVFDFIDFQNSTPKPRLDAQMAKLLGYALSDENGNRSTPDVDVPGLVKMPAERIASLYNFALSHSQMTKADAEKAEKKSEGTVTASSQ